jgi:hypothetical protein
VPRRRCDRNVKKSGAGLIPYRNSVARFGKAGLLSSDAVGDERSVAISFLFGRTFMTQKIAGRKFSSEVKEEPFHATTTRRRPYRSRNGLSVSIFKSQRGWVTGGANVMVKLSSSRFVVNYLPGRSTTLITPSPLSRNFLYIAGASSRLAGWVTTKLGSMSPASIRFKSGLV